MIAVVVVRDGVVPNGGDETVAECSGRVLLVGTGLDRAVSSLAPISTEVRLAPTAATGPATLATVLAGHLEHEPHVVLPASPDGRDLAPRLAAAMQRELFAGAMAVSPGRIDLPRRGGTELHRVVPGERFVATLQPGVRGVATTHRTDDRTGDRPATPSVTHLDAGAGLTNGANDPLDAELLEVLPPDPATIDLAEANRIVAGGAGLDGPERMTQLAQVGLALGASTGATRVITDRGWVPHERQIGTTGVVVDPRLYLAFGISGAVQHTSGLGTPDHIISVNTDAHCPMMQLADLAITADANETLTHLQRLLEQRTAPQQTRRPTEEPAP